MSAYRGFNYLLRLVLSVLRHPAFVTHYHIYLLKSETSVKDAGLPVRLATSWRDVSYGLACPRMNGATDRQLMQLDTLHASTKCHLCARRLLKYLAQHGIPNLYCCQSYRERLETTDHFKNYLTMDDATWKGLHITVSSSSYFRELSSGLKLGSKALLSTTVWLSLMHF